MWRGVPWASLLGSSNRVGWLFLGFADVAKHEWLVERIKGDVMGGLVLSYIFLLFDSEINIIKSIQLVSGIGRQTKTKTKKMLSLHKYPFPNHHISPRKRKTICFNWVLKFSNKTKLKNGEGRRICHCHPFVSLHYRSGSHWLQPPIRWQKRRWYCLGLWRHDLYSCLLHCPYFWYVPFHFNIYNSLNLAFGLFLARKVSRWSVQ